MESQENISNVDLVQLVGEITEFKSELSDNNYIEAMDVEKGDFIEKYYNQKLKYLLDTDVSSSNTINLPQVKEEMIVSINYAILNDSNLDPKIGLEIIRQLINPSGKKQQSKLTHFSP